MSLSVSLISEEMRAQISRNYVASERQARFASFYFLTFITVALVAMRRARRRLHDRQRILDARPCQ